MVLSLKVIFGSIITVSVISLIVVGTFIMNPLVFLEKEDILVGNSLYLSAPRDTVVINDTSIEGDFLVIKFYYGGGCKEHLFQLIASDSWAESYPVQTSILLSHEANNDTCMAWFTERLVFNLSPLKERYQELYKEESATIMLWIEGGSHSITLNYTF